MIKYIVTLLVMVACFGVVVAKAQDPAETWYFGWDNDTGALMAYNLAGGQTALLTLDSDIQPQAWRLGPDRALAVLSVNGSVGAYLLTPDGATALNATPGTAELLNLNLSLMDFREPYAALLAIESAYGVGLLIDLNTLTVETLSGEVYAPMTTWRFNADGTLLRYISRESRESSLWSVWERDLASGDEPKLHELESPYPIIHPDQFGERWLYRTLDTATKTLTYTVIFNDGTSQVLASETLPDDLSALPIYQFYEESLLVYHAPCEADCVIEQRPIAGGGSPQIFTLPEIASPEIIALRQISPTKLLTLIDNTFWLLDSASTGTTLGRYSPVTVAALAPDLVTSDGRWLTALGDGEIRVWDLQNSTIAWQGPLGNFALVRNGAGGIIINEMNDGRFTFFRASDQTAIPLPASESGFYIEALADGTLIFWQATEGDGRPAGVYRYNPTDGAFILLMQNLFPLTAQ